MGKGDRRSKKGKRTVSSFGKSRPRLVTPLHPSATDTKKKEEVKEEK